jgi:hypothetical protein
VVIFVALIFVAVISLATFPQNAEARKYLQKAFEQQKSDGVSS